MPVSVWHDADQTFPLGRPAARRRHAGRRPCLVEEHQPVWLQRWLKLGPGTASLDYVLAVLLLGPEVFFLSLRPSRATTFHITG